MAYQEKYNFTFKPISKNETHLVEIWQDTGDVLVAEEVESGVPPFTVELPELNNKFDVVRGTGAVINLLSDTDMKFFDGLYHVDMQEFKVYHYIDGALNWIGYLNSEMYRESYDKSENYLIQTSANDGLNLMDRLFYNTDTDTNYTGLDSEWDILKVVFDKIGLEYTDIRVSLSTTFAAFTGGAQSTILHESYVQNENFYDEDNKPMSLRDVVNSILAPYGAFMIQSNGSIYITDIETLAGSTSITYKVYNTSTFAYDSTVVETNTFTVSSIGYFGTGQEIEISGGRNRQVLTYSAYSQKDITEELLVTPDEFDTVPASFSSKNGYIYRTLDDHFLYVATYPADFEESAQSASIGLPHYVYCRIPRATSSTPAWPLVSTLAPVVNIETAELRENITERIGSRRYLDGVAIIISGRMLLKTIDNPYEGYSQSDIDRGADKVQHAVVDYALSIGNYYFNSATTSWSDSSGLVWNRIGVSNGTNQSVGNEWVDFSKILQVRVPDAQILLTGTVQIIISNQISTKNWGEEEELNSDVFDELWIGNLKLGIVNKDGSEISDADVEYIAELDKSFKREADEITLTTGTSSQFADRGKICSYDGSDYSAIKEWTRAGQTFKIEELLLGSLSSNYRAGYITLTAMRLKNDLKMINILTDTYITDRKMMTKGVVIDYHDNMYNATLEEIFEDELIIVK